MWDYLQEQSDCAFLSSENLHLGSMDWFQEVRITLKLRQKFGGISFLEEESITFIRVLRDLTIQKKLIKQL